MNKKELNEDRFTFYHNEFLRYQRLASVALTKSDRRFYESKSWYFYKLMIKVGNDLDNSKSIDYKNSVIHEDLWVDIVGLVVIFLMLVVVYLSIRKCL